MSLTTAATARVDPVNNSGTTISGTTMKVVLAQPRGFCAGVERAIEIVERALVKFGPPIYVRHE
ncbi:MAG: 4-hydroxy-3-methylbut-2-enyl diphosphate reductase, partial [Acidiphilium sp.]|nr:4-hydroxy-3-methylbut-2-enyl diphosphate reductase [Acidiphilium sp.]